MRIGILTYDFDPPIGGLGIVVRQYLERQKRSANDEFIVLSPSPNADDHVSTLARLRWKKSGGCPLFSLATNLVLNSLVRHHRLDVLHVHAGSGGVFLLRKPSCALVVTSHHTYRQEAAYVYKGAARLWKYFMSLLERRTYRLADRITCVSKDTADALAEDYGVPRQKMAVIENGIDEAYFDTSDPVQRDPATALFIGRLEERKGVFQLVDAFEQVHRHIPSAKLRLIGRNLVGNRLKDVIRVKGLTEFVDILGFIEEPMRIREMRQATIVVVPSVLEGFGLVAAEAMALGCPVIVTDCPGLRSLVRDGHTGLVVPSEDPAALADAIAKLLQDKALAERLGHEAKTEAAVRFRYERGVVDLRNVYEQAVSLKNN
jgi:glycosyltransferase involved in cell wall biosynthesis